MNIKLRIMFPFILALVIGSIIGILYLFASFVAWEWVDITKYLFAFRGFVGIFFLGGIIISLTSPKN